MNTAQFSISGVSSKRQESARAWLEFLDLPSLSMGMYHVPVGTNDKDTHSPHDRDEVYLGVSGNGQLTAGGEVHGVHAGVIIYVKAGIEHHFHDVTDDLTLLVFFSGRTETTNESQ
ncbi:MAG: cupin domain-containing protein [Planctomycetota bacterium]